MYIIGLVLCVGGGGVSFRQRKLRGAFVFEIKKTKAPKLKLKTVFSFLSANPKPDFWLVKGSAVFPVQLYP